MSRKGEVIKNFSRSLVPGEEDATMEPHTPLKSEVPLPPHHLNTPSHLKKAIAQAVVLSNSARVRRSVPKEVVLSLFFRTFVIFVFGFLYMCTCVGPYIPQHTCGGQRAICRSQFSLSIMWVPRLNLGGQAYWQAC